ncbi:Tripartite tricarboxylate transporter TctB family protein [Xaviernesmea oryzae]|uniref:Tripartite tricarboxylate transporter TctB family protein n=1 Tax=Xaviernesmea oryzae TaxID=464029 RepID=A0A1X7FQ80_9HYPH|nr:tripartite tricarboxylate transporter TctB family protein [Xaviernesmea oryzae]SMF56026.1 Tripartite tricarboxylate transporter TctB family protein [Xaviernesmea oryzae]
MTESSKRSRQVTFVRFALAVALAGTAGIAWMSFDLGIWDQSGPGPGFLPFVEAIGLGLIVLAGLPAYRASSDLLLMPANVTSILGQAAVVAAFAILMPYFGFVAAAWGIVIATAWLNGERNWLAMLLLGGGCAFGIQYLFAMLGTTL